MKINNENEKYMLHFIFHTNILHIISLYELKCTIHAILQHMGFYHTTENPCVMMRAKHNTKSCECLIIHQDELYIASSTLQEILHIVKEKYNIQINSNVYQGSDFPYDPGGTMIC